MSAQNTQSSRSQLIRTDMIARMVHLQTSTAGAANLVFAPVRQSDSLTGEYQALVGDGFLDFDRDDIFSPKAELAEPARTAQKYARLTYEIQKRRFGRLDLDLIDLADKRARGLDPIEDHSRRELPKAITVHARLLAQRMASTGADRAFPADATSTTGYDFRDPAADLRGAIDEAIEFMHERGAFGDLVDGSFVAIVGNRRVARPLARNLQIADSRFIASAGAGDEIIELGGNPEGLLQEFFSSQFDAPVPIRWVPDNQFGRAGGQIVPVFSDDLYVVLVTPDGIGGFVSTPVPDWAEVMDSALGDTAGAQALRAWDGPSPLAVIHEAEIDVPRGWTAWVESVFGLDFYGFGSSDVEQVFGYRIPDVLSS